MNIFSKKPTAKEALRESKREMAHATRGMYATLQIKPGSRYEKKLVAEIKRTAKTGNELLYFASLLLITRHVHFQAMSAQTSVAVGMKGASKAMAAMNKVLFLISIYSLWLLFPLGANGPRKADEGHAGIPEAISTNGYDCKFSPMHKIEYAIDDVLDDDEAEDDTEDLTNQVLDEIGVDVASQLSAAPKGKVAGRNTEEADSSRMDELEKRSSREPVPAAAPREKADGFGSMLGRNLCVVVLDRRPLLDTNLLDRPSVASSDELSCLLLEMTAALLVELTFRAARPLSISSC
ncbi:hypothetical protein SASPL_111189 [Salvia splendens]|uniref:Uncharacterized protein n=1 Tax=Salvia splendens TaxID=180675 RepID=A0A8X8YBG1_SALSN|nr:hypothetical protein SASPL_111189 [Salvia splendens]